MNDNNVNAKIIPLKLYKYRKTTKRNLDMLIKHTAWFSSPSSWNDKRDMLLPINNDNLNKLQYDCYSFEVKRILDNFSNILKNFRDNYLYYCLSSDNNIDKQWEDYGDKGKGFCVEYDSQRILKIMNIEKIKYASKIEINPCDLIFIAKCSLEKSKEYEVQFNNMLYENILKKDKSFECEKEYRIVKKIIGEVLNEVPFDYVTAIYLGENISDYFEKRLINISKKLHVPIYKRYLDENKLQFKFKKIQ